MHRLHRSRAEDVGAWDGYLARSPKPTDGLKPRSVEVDKQGVRGYFSSNP